MRIGLYAHGGSGNHGCEALARSTMRFLGNHDYTLFSERPEEDYRYGLGELASIVPSQNDMPRGLGKLVYDIRMKIAPNDSAYWRSRYNDFTKKIKGLDFAVAIGGDNYCYSGFPERFAILNRKMARKGIPLILWGCSIDKERLSPIILEDLKRYRLIVARESITFDALKESGLGNVILMPDTAFLLDEKETALPRCFIPNNMVGLNVSPLIIRKEIVPGVILQNCRRLIDFILENTDMGVLLIPHVVWKGNDDRAPLRQLYDEYHSSGRILMIDDFDARIIKGVIRRCRFLVAARTHASIAGYATGVPTLAFGYSVKSRGIATDLFGTADHYVLPVEEIKEDDILTNTFQWLLAHEEKVRSLYDAKLGPYLSQLDKSVLNGRV